MARLLMALYDSDKTIFTTADAVRITRLQPSHTSSLLHKAAKRGLVSRLKRGLFVIVPPEMGSSTEYFGNPYLAGRSGSDCPKELGGNRFVRARGLGDTVLTDLAHF
jgi:predicted transcriptional regulator of viral defense system